VYLSNIGVITRSMGYKDVPSTGDWLQNSEQIIEHLSRIKNLNTRKNKLMRIIVFAKAYESTCLPPWRMPTAKKPTS
jgi:hypothetical protein